MRGGFESIPTAGSIGRRFARKGQWRRRRSIIPDYPTLPLDRENSQDDLRSKIIHYLYLLLKHKYLVTAIVCLFLFAGVIVTLQMQKIYSATTTIKIDQYVPQVFKTQSTQTEQSSDDTLETAIGADSQQSRR